MAGQQADMPSATKPRSTVGMQDALGNVTAAGDSIA
jgi:hypothetical protein